uniref:SH2 domain-containing protein 4B n=1 Tax=Oryzias sinensis TaxID=183150 RepID=A0A8C7YS63_9TELE
MLEKILKDMWVEPALLEALNEEQKRILFLKMREEQVRRWTEREKREEKEGRSNTCAKKASSKHVSWLLGRDGDVSVSVLGEVDEFRSSKILQNLESRLHTDNMNGIQTADLLPGREAQQLSFKDNVKLPLADVNEEPVPSNGQSSEGGLESDGDLKDPSKDGESGGSSDDISHWDPLCRPHFGSHGNQPLKAQLSDTERASQEDRGEKKTSLCEENRDVFTAVCSQTAF